MHIKIVFQYPLEKEMATPSIILASVQFSRSVMSDSLRPRSITNQLPAFTQTHVHRVSDAIQPSHPLLSPSAPAFNLSQRLGLFK